MVWAGLAVLMLAVAAIVAWKVWRPAPLSPGLVEASGRIEGDWPEKRRPARSSSCW
jgi:hypothetical protein